MEMLPYLPFLFFFFIIFARFKPDPRIALLAPADRRAYRWGMFLVAVPPAAALPVLMFFLSATSNTRPGRQMVAALVILGVISAACFVTGLVLTRRALASVPSGKVEKAGGVDDLA